VKNVDMELVTYVDAKDNAKKSGILRIWEYMM